MAINRLQLEQALGNQLISNMLAEDIPDDVRPSIEQTMRDLARSIVTGVEIYITANIDLNDQKIKSFEQKIAELEARLDTAEGAIGANTTTIASIGGGGISA